MKSETFKNIISFLIRQKLPVSAVGFRCWFVVLLTLLFCQSVKQAWGLEISAHEKTAGTLYVKCEDDYANKPLAVNECSIIVKPYDVFLE